MRHNINLTNITGCNVRLVMISGSRLRHEAVQVLHMSTRWAHGKSLILPCQTQKHILSSSGSPVPGLFFLEASNPGGSLAWRHTALSPPLCLLMCCTHALISFAAHEHQSLPRSFWLLTSEHLIKTDCLIRRLIWPAEGFKPYRKEALSADSVGWCEYKVANQAPSPSLTRPSPLLLLHVQLLRLDHVTRKCGSLPFPLLKERKYLKGGWR